ncbi:Cd209 antigen [Plakobranchus ocellatus]|uniref:Cd209 antigen n=1 Tax=Plakobranchus ocellatus TaxID=259542 RepID=A0AAV4B9Q5_9GAST|nr:Cd209 antigen [Plakobranchus ocellatus]
MFFPDISNYLVSRKFRHSIYLLYKHYINFRPFDAHRLCGNFGAHLVELDSLEEQDFLQKLVIQSNNTNKYVFVGVTDLMHEGTFIHFFSGKPMPTLRWKKGNPDNWQEQDCVEINWYGLNDVRCLLRGSFICEIRFDY